MASSLVFIETDPSLALELDQSQAKDDDKQDPGDRRCIALLEVLKATAIQVIHQRDRRIVRSLGRIHQNEDLLKDLHGLDGGNGNDVKSCGCKHGQRDAPETVPCTGAIDGGSFI